MKDLGYYMGLPYTEIVRLDEEGDFVSRVAELPGCVAHGKTRSEALENLQEVKELWFENALERRGQIPEPEAESLPSGKWLQRVPRSLHRKLVARAKIEGVSLNQFVATILAEAVGRKQQLEAESILSQLRMQFRDFIFGSCSEWGKWDGAPNITDDPPGLPSGWIRKYVSSRRFVGVVCKKCARRKD